MPFRSTLLAVCSRSGLHLLEIRESGEPSGRGSADLPPLETVRRLAFQPSGHYLDTSREGEGLRIFRVEEDDTLHETARETRGGGEIVVTAPPS